jgi:hypothetical protein
MPVVAVKKLAESTTTLAAMLLVAGVATVS